MNGKRERPLGHRADRPQTWAVIGGRQRALWGRTSGPDIPAQPKEQRRVRSAPKQPQMSPPFLHAVPNGTAQLRTPSVPTEPHPIPSCAPTWDDPPHPQHPL